ncbi:MAG: hypothetical protein JSS49_17160 [Planctomycetes bacterium]|nr:hypothetical protein [Planctomycetota bacterium]
MFSFLGELIVLVAWLFQRECRSLSDVMGRVPAGLEMLTVAWLGTINSCNSSWPANAAHRLAIGPPWDRFSPLLGGNVWSGQWVAVSIPSRHSIRG